MNDRVPRVGPNAPTARELRRIALLDRTRALLFERAFQTEDIAEALGVSAYQISHLRSDLQAYSFGQRQAANALLERFLAWAMKVLEETPDLGSTADALTLGQHLRRELAYLRHVRGSASTQRIKPRKE